MMHNGFHRVHHCHVYPCTNLCYWCGRKCECVKKKGSEPTLIKLSKRKPTDTKDNVGWICQQRHVRGCPPHKLFVDKLLRAFLKGDTNLTDLIAKYAHPVCTEPFRGYCYKRNPQMQPGHRCPVCKRMATDGLPLLWSICQGRFWPTSDRCVPGGILAES